MPVMPILEGLQDLQVEELSDEIPRAKRIGNLQD